MADLKAAHPTDVTVPRHCNTWSLFLVVHSRSGPSVARSICPLSIASCVDHPSSSQHTDSPGDTHHRSPHLSGRLISPHVDGVNFYFCHLPPTLFSVYFVFDCSPFSSFSLYFHGCFPVLLIFLSLYLSFYQSMYVCMYVCS